ncbi:MAG: hypothetical protein JNN01_05900 [Opitutaceae bacterium]|nr:hypothetical protein [Opitutaceae bacterium]
MSSNPTKLILVASLLVNLSLMAYLNLRSPENSQVSIGSPQDSSEPNHSERNHYSETPSPLQRPIVNWSSDWDGRTLRELASRLGTLGFPSRVVRAIIADLIEQKYDSQKARVLTSASGSGGLYFTGRISARGHLETNRIDTAKASLLREALGETEIVESETEKATRLRVFGNIPVRKANEIAEISNRIEQLRLTLLSEGSTPHDLRVLESEKLDAIKNILTDTEFQEYCLNQTPVGMKTKNTLLGIEVDRNELMQILDIQSIRFAEYTKDVLPSAVSYHTDQVNSYRALAATLGTERYVKFLKNEGRDFKILADQVIDVEPSVGNEKLVEIWDYHLDYSLRALKLATTYSQSPNDLRWNLDALYLESSQRGRTIMSDSVWARFEKWPAADWLRRSRPSTPR